MNLNKTKGNMYQDVDYTANPIRGECYCKCDYCYIRNSYIMSQHYQGQPRLINSFDGFPENKGRIFVGSGIDMFAPNVQKRDIIKVLKAASQAEGNEYLFQTRFLRNIPNFIKYIDMDRMMFGTTIESGKTYTTTKAPSPQDRLLNAWIVSRYYNLRSMISVEPIMDFDVNSFTGAIISSQPEYVSIGADSGNNNLDEPPKNKVLDFISKLKKASIETRIKPNLERIIGTTQEDEK